MLFCERRVAKERAELFSIDLVAFISVNRVEETLQILFAQNIFLVASCD